MAFVIRWCHRVLEFFKPSTFASTLESRQRRGRSTTTLSDFASSANTKESMEVELAIKWSCQQGVFFAARVLGKLSRLKALQRRETRRGREKRHMPSVEGVLLRRSVRRHCKENVFSKRATTFTKNRKTFEGTGSCTTT